MPRSEYAANIALQAPQGAAVGRFFAEPSRTYRREESRALRAFRALGTLALFALMGVLLALGF